MLPVQIHLMIVHVPVLATLFATVLLLAAGFRQRNDWRHMAYGLLVLTAAAAVVAFFSGHGAEEKVEHLLGVSESSIESHEDLATAGFALALLNGILSAVLLALSAKLSGPSRRMLARTLLVTTVAAGAVFAVAAHRGGLIRHSELSSEPAPILIPPMKE